MDFLAGFAVFLVVMKAVIWLLGGQPPARPRPVGEDDYSPPHWLDEDDFLARRDQFVDHEPIAPVVRDHYLDLIASIPSSFFDDDLSGPTFVEINPATGLEMVGATDTGGHLYGHDD